MSRNRFDIYSKRRYNFGLNLLTKVLVSPLQIGKAISKDISASSKQVKDASYYEKKVEDGRYYEQQLHKASILSSFLCDCARSSSDSAISVLSKLSSIASNYNSANASRREDYYSYVIAKLNQKISQLKTESSKNEYRQALELFQLYISDDGKNKFKQKISSIK